MPAKHPAVGREVRMEPKDWGGGFVKDVAAGGALAVPDVGYYTATIYQLRTCGRQQQRTWTALGKRQLPHLDCQQCVCSSGRRLANLACAAEYISGMCALSASSSRQRT